METVSTEPVKAVPLAPPPVQKTLNGYDQDVAVQMIANFALNYLNDTSSKSLTAWYSAGELNNINNLLLAEADIRPTDGVRFYFGCDAPPAGTTQLAVSILMVSTETRDDPAANQSAHGDYYDHTADFLSAGTTGATTDNNAAGSAARGASLYGAAAPPNDLCGEPSQHYLDTTTVYDWVSRHCETNASNVTSPLNTKSEWFPLPFITGLFSSITKGQVQFGFDGMRIYLGKGYIDKDGLMRDVFILVPTTAGANDTHLDYYNCLEDLSLSSFGDPIGADRASVEKFPARAVHLEKFRKAAKGISPWYSGGYDNGELCPDVCN
jgi:hypothetical protein